MRKLLYFIVVILVFTSCKTRYITNTVEVPIETIKTEYKNSIQYDSIYVHDSINVFTKGDTVFKDKLKIVYKEKVKNDTVHLTDSIDRPIYLTKEIPINVLTKTQSFLVYSGTALYVVIILLLIGLGFYKLFKRR